MKRVAFIFFLLTACLVYGNAQPVFTTVPVVNGKVVFQQYVYLDQEMPDNERYSLLNKWGKDKFSGSPLLTGIRFDDKAKSMTVGSRAELLLPQNAAGITEKIIMSYRFDASINNMGCMLVIRDITYQTVPAKGASAIPKSYTAEETIADSAISSGSADEKGLKENIKKSSLTFFNQLYDELNGVFGIKK